MVALDVETVLVPVDGSDASSDAAEFAVAVAERYGASVHVLYVFGEEVARAIETGTVETSELADENRAFVADVRELAKGGDVTVDSSTAYGFSTTRKTHHPGNVILDCAEEVDADFLVVPRDSVGGAGAADVLEKAAEYVLLYASQPVLSV